MKTGCKPAARLNLTQCRLLVANGMISKSGKDYEHEEVISRLLELQEREDERKLKALMRNLSLIPEDELPPPLPYDSYLTPPELYEYGLSETPF